MIPKVELDTIEEWKAKLGAFADNKKILPVLNMILTRRHFPECFAFSNEFIAQQANTLPDIVRSIDEIPFRPLQQMFDHEDMCDACVSCNQLWRFLYPWTGSTNVVEESLPAKAFCKVTEPSNMVLCYSTNASSWIMKTEDRAMNLIVCYKDSEIRVQQTGYSQLGRYHLFTDKKEFMRFFLLVKYLACNGKYITMNNYDLGTDAMCDIMKSDNWKTTPSLVWNENIANLDSRVSALSTNRAESVKTVSERFKKQIEDCGSLSEFMEAYYPKTNIITLAAMCRAGEQPA